MANWILASIPIGSIGFVDGMLEIVACSPSPRMICMGFRNSFECRATLAFKNFFGDPNLLFGNLCRCCCLSKVFKFGIGFL